MGSKFLSQICYPPLAQFLSEGDRKMQVLCPKCHPYLYSSLPSFHYGLTCQVKTAIGPIRDGPWTYMPSFHREQNEGM